MPVVPVPSDPTTGLPPAPVPVDTPAARDELDCPLCGYSLRGLAEQTLESSRCPECGYAFEWAELLAARQYRHPYLFEQHPERNVVSFVKTVLAGLRPRRFWSSLHAAHAVRPRRLLLYWVVVATVILLTGAGGSYVVRGVTLYRAHTQVRAMYAAIPARASRPPLPPNWLNANYPLPPDRAFFKRVFVERLHDRIDAHVSLACLAWPWLSMATLLIFRAALRRARIRSAHVMRCVVYCGDVFLWVGPLAILASLLLADTLFRSSKADEVWRAVGVLVLLATVFACRLGVAYRRYLRLEQAWATVIVSQFVVGLFVVTAMSVLSDDFFWLVF